MNNSICSIPAPHIHGGAVLTRTTYGPSCSSILHQPLRQDSSNIQQNKSARHHSVQDTATRGNHAYLFSLTPCRTEPVPWWKVLIVTSCNCKSSKRTDKTHNPGIRYMIVQQSLQQLTHLHCIHRTKKKQNPVVKYILYMNNVKLIYSKLYQ